MTQPPSKPRGGLLGRMFGGRNKAAGPSAAADSVDAVVDAQPPQDVAGSAAIASTQSDAVHTHAADHLQASQENTVRFEVSLPEPHEETPVEAPPGPAKVGWFQRLKSGLSHTSSNLGDGITGLFTKRKLDDATIEELEDLLIQADLGVETAMRITASLSKSRYNKTIAAEDVRAVLAREVEAVLAPVAQALPLRPYARPHVILVVGVNGTGKTTTIGKLAHIYRQNGKSVMLAAGDTFRAAAIDQLKIWGERTGSAVVAGNTGSDAAGLVFDALKSASDQGIDVLLIDTAGRLQNKAGLMAELEKVVRVIKKIDSTAPHDVLLVLDATTGQNALNQVDVFKDKAGVSGLVMTKLDGTARGGILVAIAAKFGLPVYAIGIGEGIDDLQSFDAGEFARAIAHG